ncbi:hypothetical protein ACWD8I_26000 [Micromonospora arida]|uniref:hypothetical protein n=1 Tax=Micromonospora arida TaxID=2203715 RepID=UPI0033F32513
MGRTAARRVRRLRPRSQGEPRRGATPDGGPGPGSYSHPIDREEGLARLAEAEARRTIVWENLLLLGDAATVAAAASWRDAIWQVERLARRLVEAPPDIAETLTRANEARDGYYRAARRSLGVRGGSVEQSAALREALISRSGARPDIPAN